MTRGLASPARYDDLESYCSALQGQMKDVQSQSGDRARALQTALEQEKDRCTQLRTLNDEAFELMALQELRIVSRLAVTFAVFFFLARNHSEQGFCEPFGAAARCLP
jgi:hypothetical protein